MEWRLSLIWEIPSARIPKEIFRCLSSVTGNGMLEIFDQFMEGRPVDDAAITVELLDMMSETLQNAKQKGENRSQLAFAAELRRRPQSNDWYE